MLPVLGIVGYRTIAMGCDAGVRSAILRHFLKPELLAAMKDCLRGLENVKLTSPDDIDIIYHKRVLCEKIAELENEDDPAA